MSTQADRRKGIAARDAGLPYSRARFWIRFTGASMNAVERTSRRVRATVQVVLPLTGLAYVEDEALTSWAITKSMRGSGLDQLHAGQHLELTVEEHPEYSLVSDYAPLD